MPSLSRTNRASHHLLGMLLWVMGCAAAQAQGAQSERQRVYQQDRQRCLSGQSYQSQASCLREAGAALQHNMVGQSTPDAEQMAANAVRRCEAFTGDARQSCLGRIQGPSTVQGSVETGGILRELTEPGR